MESGASTDGLRGYILSQSRTDPTREPKRATQTREPKKSRPRSPRREPAVDRFRKGSHESYDLRPVSQYAHALTHSTWKSEPRGPDITGRAPSIHYGDVARRGPSQAGNQNYPTQMCYLAHEGQVVEIVWFPSHSHTHVHTITLLTCTL